MKTEEEKNIENKPLEDTDTVASGWGPAPNPVLDYTDTVTPIDPTKTTVTGDPTATVNLTLDYKIQLFQKKIEHFTDIGNNDFLGFTLVFGNTSSKAFEPGNSSVPTLTDELDLTTLSGIKLTLVDLCIPDCYKLFRAIAVLPDASIDPCDDNPLNPFDNNNNVFVGGRKYTLTLKKCTNCSTMLGKKVCTNWDKSFDIPCQSICCISMLFRIDPADPCNCDEDCCLED